MKLEGSIGAGNKKGLQPCSSVSVPYSQTLECIDSIEVEVGGRIQPAESNLISKR